jgi:hypothetical protein
VQQDEFLPAGICLNQIFRGVKLKIERGNPVAKNWANRLKTVQILKQNPDATSRVLQTEMHCK